MLKKTLHGDDDHNQIEPRPGFLQFYVNSRGTSGHGRIQRGGQGFRNPPEKSQKYRVSLQYWSGSPEKSQSYQASIQCWAII